MANEHIRRPVEDDDSVTVHPPKGRFIGEVFDTITYPDGRVEKREKSFNIVVESVSALIAALIKNDPAQNTGKLYWAFGVGQPIWDNEPYTPASRNTKLVTEVYRKEITSGQRFFIDNASQKLPAGEISNRLQLEVTLGTGEANGYSLREFGIFGGNATGATDSGIQINHKSHARIDKVEGMTIERTVRFTF